MSAGRYARFVVVGAVAGATHFLVAVGLVSLAGWAPQFANIAGYCVALVTSYLGQSRWTFSQPGVSLASFLRFALTSFSGFVLNAAAYAALLYWTRLDYRVALFLVMLLVAVLTFLGLNKWVFAAPKQRSAA